MALWVKYSYFFKVMFWRSVSDLAWWILSSLYHLSVCLSINQSSPIGRESVKLDIALVMKDIGGLSIRSNCTGNPLNLWIKYSQFLLIIQLAWLSPTLSSRYFSHALPLVARCTPLLGEGEAFNEAIWWF